MLDSTDEFSIVIWDLDGNPIESRGPIILWRSFDDSFGRNVLSLPQFIDQHAEDLRQRFLAFVYELGEAQIRGSRIVDHLEIRPGLSYWWMTLIAQKDVYAQSPYIYDVIKLLAIDDIARSYEQYSVIFHSSNANVALALSAWCRKQGRGFDWRQPKRDRKRHNLLRVAYKSLPSPLRSLFTLGKYAARRLRVPTHARSTARHWQNGIAIFDVFTHIHSESMSTGVFRSGYWSDLVPLLEQLRIGVNWCHWYHEHPAVPNLHRAISASSIFTTSANGQSHRIIDSDISLRLVLKVLRDFARLNVAAIVMGNISTKFCASNSDLNLWPLFKRDWNESIRGPRAIISLLHLNILEEELTNAASVQLGLYIQENQPWEFALIHFWKKQCKGSLIGVAHTTVPFWDLRYLFDSRMFQEHARLPMPDLVALNGPDALAKFAKAGYPANRYCEVEALRYQSLQAVSRLREHGSIPSKTIRLLVLGDLIPQYTSTQLAFLKLCPRIPELTVDVTFKPHPATTDSDWEKSGIGRISHRRISEELSICDAVFVGSATSAAADAYHVGIPVISVNEGQQINFSPLYGLPEVTFVNSPVELARALSSVALNRGNRQHVFFTIEDGIPRWKDLIVRALHSRENDLSPCSA